MPEHRVVLHSISVVVLHTPEQGWCWSVSRHDDRTAPDTRRGTAASETAAWLLALATAGQVLAERLADLSTSSGELEPTITEDA